MKARLVVAAALVALASGATGARAQTAGQCPAGSSALDPQRVTQDACQLAVDLFQYMAPQLGLAVTGGNATLGQGGPLGGFGKVLLSARANVLRGSLPQVQDVTLSTGGRVQRGSGGAPAIEGKGQILGFPTIDASIGLFKGIPLGVTNVGGLDLLVSASYVPSINTSAIDVSTDNPFRFGLGARVGLLQESIVVPGVSFTILQRKLPRSTITGVTDRGDSLVVRGLDVSTTAWRVVASKTFLAFGLAAGVGQDDYDSSTDAIGVVQTPVGTVRSAPVALSQSMKRTNMFLDLSVGVLPSTKLLFEIGRVSGGSVTTYNQFTGTAPDAPRIYGALGLRVGL